jgi:hypothetical protein
VFVTLIRLVLLGRTLSFLECGQRVIVVIGSYVQIRPHVGEALTQHGMALSGIVLLEYGQHLL